MLIAMVTMDHPDNERADMTRRTIESLMATVDFPRHRLMISDNGSTDPLTISLLHEAEARGYRVFWNGTNLGTARGVNRIWQERLSGEHACKIDNDVVIHNPGWVDTCEQVFKRDPSIGLLGLKRKDLPQCPSSPNAGYVTELKMLPHERGELWLMIEESRDVVGTCVTYSSLMLDKLGYLYQGSWLYGFEDSLMCERAHVAGFRTAFLPYVEIDHIDKGGTPHALWKRAYALPHLAEYGKWVADFKQGVRPIYCGPEEE